MCLIPIFFYTFSFSEGNNEDSSRNRSSTFAINATSPTFDPTCIRPHRAPSNSLSTCQLWWRKLSWRSYPVEPEAASAPLVWRSYPVEPEAASAGRACDGAGEVSSGVARRAFCACACGGQHDVPTCRRYGCGAVPVVETVRQPPSC